MHPHWLKSLSPSRCRPLVATLLVFTFCFTLAPFLVAAQDQPAPWEPWANLDITTLTDDGTGSTFASSDVDGEPALQITPGGGSEETKLAWPVSGDDLIAWAGASWVDLDVYLPETNMLNPNNFFMGLADVTGEWAWMDGVFGDASGDSGWITVHFDPANAVQQVQADGQYILYLSFFDENKTPLTEPFYAGPIRVIPGSSTASGSAGSAYAGAVPMSEEVTALLAMDDADFMDAVAHQTFDYFWQEVNPDNGLIRDRSTATSPASIAAVGFGLAAIPVGVERGWITADEGTERALTTLNTFLDGGVQGEHGFYYHFVDMHTGERVWDSELSSIDTSLLAAGALVAGQYFGGEVQTAANELYERIEWDWMTNGGEFVSMGGTPDGGFLDAAWDHFDESQILYALAIGSPTHPISASAWADWIRPINVSDESIYLPGDPLFVYQYPQAFLNLRGLEDAFANYWNNTTRACERHRDYIAANTGDYATYSHGAWGLSASDGPNGYRAYGAAPVNNDGTIAPYASAACVPFTPADSLASMRALLTAYGDRVWREYGFVSAVNETARWYSRDHIGIDQGDILLMLANAQDGLVWNAFMSHPAIQSALDAMGFVESTGDYAITPAYWTERMGQ